MQPTNPLRETTYRGFGYVELPPFLDCEEDWSIPVCDEEMPSEPVQAAAALSGAVAGNAAKLLRPRTGWASKGLLMCSLFLGGLIVGLQLYAANSIAPPGARQESRQVRENTPVPADKPITVAEAGKVPTENVPTDKAPNSKPAEAPVTAPAPARPSDAKPRSTASLYDRVRQVVLENKTEETQRLGMGDVAYRDVPEDGSIMVGMEVTYAPFFTHNVIKSVRPIYQRADGTRYDGPISGTPTADRERVVAKEGYAIGGAAIKSGMGIDGMQLTFMEIGADGLNTNKSYLSKWLGGYGGADARTFLNDGRPIVGIAGMWSRNNFGPAFCLGLVTTRAGAIAAADGAAVAVSRQVTGK